ncbi:MAG: hypothetical protein ACRD3O_04340 [Terriglobia bacterium]
MEMNFYEVVISTGTQPLASAQQQHRAACSMAFPAGMEILPLILKFIRLQEIDREGQVFLFASQGSVKVNRNGERTPHPPSFVGHPLPRQRVDRVRRIHQPARDG